MECTMGETRLFVRAGATIQCVMVRVWGQCIAARVSQIADVNRRKKFTPTLYSTSAEAKCALNFGLIEKYIGVESCWRLLRCGIFHSEGVEGGQRDAEYGRVSQKGGQGHRRFVGGMRQVILRGVVVGR